MGKRVYNKLVRDKIPSTIRSEGAIPTIRKITDGEIFECLNKKLMEETQEFLSSNKVEELVDIYEVILAILDKRKISLHEFEKMRCEKMQKRGAFVENIFLMYVED